MDPDVILKLNSLKLTRDLSFSLRSRYGTFFVRALQLLNLSAMATLETEERGVCSEVAVMGGGG